MQAPSTDHLFQSDAQLAKASARAAKSERIASAGDPLQLPSKPLEAVVRGEDVWTGESGAVVRRTSLRTGKTVQLYKHHSGPVTALAFYTLPASSGALKTTQSGGSVEELLFTASWDKSIKVSDTKTRQLLHSNPNAHTDFVKCLTVIPSLKLLVSGGSDKDIRLWDLQRLEAHEYRELKGEPSVSETLATALDGVAETVKTTLSVSSAGETHEGSSNLASSSGGGSSSSSSSSSKDPVFPPLACLASLKSRHTRPIETFAFYPLLATSPDKDQEPVETGHAILWSADSMGRICVWELWRDDDEEGSVQTQFKYTWLAHETAIYDIKMGIEGEAWTVSADQLATLWTFDPTKPTEPPIATLRLPHPYYVKTILPLEHSLPGSDMHYVLTGSTDEEIRLWDLSLLDPSEGAGSIDGSVRGPLAQSSAANASQFYKDGKKPHGLMYELEGHFHEVNRLALSSLQGELYVISASLDCTIRKWNLRDLLELAKSKAFLENDADPSNDERTEEERQTLRDIRSGKEERPKEQAMTEEEERELEELMGDD